MRTVKEIYDFLNSKAPVAYKMDFDNPGFLVGDGSWQVEKVLLALDITDGVIDEAVECGADLIVSHHPLFFSLKSVNSETSTGARAVKLIENRIAGVCMHTNLDAVHEGVNDALAEKLGLMDIEAFEESGVDENGRFYGIGRIGKTAQPVTMAEFLPFVKTALKCNGLRYHDAGKPVSRVAVGGGSCGSYLELAAEKGCDTLVTSDVKYDTFLDAKRMEMNLIDADHFCTENVVVPVLERWLKAEFPELELRVSKRHCQTAQFF
ncbi:MAG: Nif3-like dinuclear metal center hexameric protein [Clostridiales bacterium]|nr:Nif3-like dinuclear metal center hexameric protein [Clostridiales bacterium]